ncbi:hypothetical protein XELAEV_18033760mg [Xenopus laevis]|uniref:Uncharacterized protein n=1 Tax=Xenopus laevis TaxID=8355 RepID=A0A974CKY4_XENLA|nr:hypothetical protein XELAEV_18033760mg [Xenopus laevis]
MSSQKTTMVNMLFPIWDTFCLRQILELLDDAEASSVSVIWVFVSIQELQGIHITDLQPKNLLVHILWARTNKTCAVQWSLFKPLVDKNGSVGWFSAKQPMDVT